LLADPQILSQNSYPGRSRWLNVITQFIVDLNMKKSWRTVSKLHPNAVIFMGDLMDDGRADMPSKE
jgi:hypothetical protein